MTNFKISQIVYKILVLKFKINSFINIYYILINRLLRQNFFIQLCKLVS